MKPVLMILASLVLLVLVFFSGVIIAANVITEPEPHKLANVDAPDLWTAKPKPIDTAAQSYPRLPDAKPAVSEAAANTAPAPVGQQSTATNQSAASTPPIDTTVTSAVNLTGGPAGNTPPGNAPADALSPGAQGTTNMAASTSTAVNAAQAQWCYARYRSYRVQDNTYQPYDGSPRRQCQGPMDGSAQASGQAPASQVSARLPQNVAASQSGQVQGQRQMQAQSMAEARQVRPQRPVSQQDAMRPVPPEAVPYRDASYQSEEPQTLVDGPYAPVVQQVDTASPGGSHEEWCHGRYRSYRIEDNSYQPFEGGPRRQCQSPFG